MAGLIGDGRPPDDAWPTHRPQTSSHPVLDYPVGDAVVDHVATLLGQRLHFFACFAHPRLASLSFALLRFGQPNGRLL
jgi:hypothetical protein